MQTKMQIKSLKLPKLLGDLTHSNQFLKMFSVSTLGLLIVAIVLIFALSTRTPVVLTFKDKSTPMDSSGLPNPEADVEAAIRHYIELRYQWTPDNVRQKLTDAQSMIQSSSLKSYQGAVMNVIKFSTEKQVSQRVYPSLVGIDLEKRIANIQGDRITAIQGLKAAGDLKLELTFEFGPRTRANPWGIYIAKEKELTN